MLGADTSALTAQRPPGFVKVVDFGFNQFFGGLV